MGEVADPYSALKKLKKKLKRKEPDIFEKDVGILTGSPKTPKRRKKKR